LPDDPALDVFVSYAHADDGVPLGSSMPHGWVTAFVANLNQGPNALKKRLFIDHQLRPGDDFGSDLLAKVQRSAVLVLLLSQNYIDSRWCGAEVEHFVRTHDADLANTGSVFVVELFPYERLNNIPPVIATLRKRLIHAKFWFQRTNAAEPTLAGYPSPQESGLDGSAHYWRVLSELRMALDDRLRRLHAGRARPVDVQATVSAPAEAAPAPAPREVLGTVLLADTTDDLEAQRNALRLMLQAEQVQVRPEGDYVGLTPAEFDAAIATDLGQASLFVQLLSSTPGRKIRGFDAPLPQLQFLRAQAAGLPLIQWCDRLPTPGEITDPAHARLFETEHLRVTNLPDFSTGVIERLRADKARRRQAEAMARTQAADASSIEAVRPHQRQIFLDDLAGEPSLNEHLRALIRLQDCGVRSLPPGTPLGNNGIDVQALLRPCSAGITVYTDRSKFAAAYNRLIHFLNQVAEGDLPLARWGVYLRQGTVSSVFGIESDEVVPIDEGGLADFLRGLSS
jgi:hypothetical protein